MSTTTKRRYVTEFRADEIERMRQRDQDLRSVGFKPASDRIEKIAGEEGLDPRCVRIALRGKV